MKAAVGGRRGTRSAPRRAVDMTADEAAVVGAKLSRMVESASFMAECRDVQHLGTELGLPARRWAADLLRWLLSRSVSARTEPIKRRKDKLSPLKTSPAFGMHACIGGGRVRGIPRTL